MKTWLYLCFLSVMIAAPAIGPAVKTADAALVTQLDLTGGAVNWTGPHGCWIGSSSRAGRSRWARIKRTSWSR